MVSKGFGFGVNLIKETLISGGNMQPNTNGNAQPDSVKVGQETETTKTRTYSTPDGKRITITEEEFAVVVEIFGYLRKSRDEKNAQVDGVEPEKCAQGEETAVEERAG